MTPKPTPRFDRQGIGMAVALLREAAGWSQGQLASKTGLDRGEVAALEAGKVPFDKAPFELAAILSVLGRQLDARPNK